MKKDGLFASVLSALVEEEKRRSAEKPPNLITNQKKQLWYLMMNQIDGDGTEEDSVLSGDHTTETAG